MTAIDEHVTTIRTMVEALPDEAIIGLIDPIVRGLVNALIGEVNRNADGITDRIVASITAQLRTAAETSAPAAEVAPEPVVELPATEPEPAPAPSRRDLVHHTCEICGREGTRRYTQTATGWRCSKTATACPGNRTTPVLPAEAAMAALVAAPAAESESIQVVKPAPIPPRAETKPAGGSNITARCEDCTRVWTLTGRVLDMAISTHEHRSGHIVHIEDGTT